MEKGGVPGVPEAWAVWGVPGCFVAFDLKDAHIQVCGAPAQHDVLAVCSQLRRVLVYDVAVIYKLYVIMYIHISCSLSSTEYIDKLLCFTCC